MAEKSNPGFLILLDFYEPLQCLTDAEKGQVFDACFAYHLGRDVEFDDPLVKMAFSFIKPFFDKQCEAYARKCEQNRANALKKYGEKRTDANACERMQSDANGCEGSQIKVKTEFKDKSKTKVNSPNGEVKSQHAAKKKISFTPPTIEEVQEYCDERMNNIDAQHFHDYYAARGWKLKDGQKMQDWKACVRTWERNDGGRQQGNILQMPHPISEAERRQIHNDEVCRQVLADINAGKEGPWV